jgi:hypothetical protein
LKTWLTALTIGAVLTGLQSENMTTLPCFVLSANAVREQIAVNAPGSTLVGPANQVVLEKTHHMPDLESRLVNISAQVRLPDGGYRRLYWKVSFDSLQPYPLHKDRDAILLVPPELRGQGIDATRMQQPFARVTLVQDEGNNKWRVKPVPRGKARTGCVVPAEHLIAMGDH